MRQLYLNSPKLKLRRKELRNNPTDVEKFLWLKLKGKQLGYKFIRQYSVGNYVVDFCCPEKRLAVELELISKLST